MFLRRLVFAVLVVTACVRADQMAWQVLPAGDAAAGGETRVTVFALNRGGEAAPAELPDQVRGTLVDGATRWTVELRAVSAEPAKPVPAGGFVEREYTVALPGEATGRLVLELERASANRAVIDVAGGGPVAKPAAVVAQGSAPVAKQKERAGKGTTSTAPSPAMDQIQRAFRDHFYAHMPVYFIYGPEAPAAKFQFSFKYRMISDSAMEEGRAPALRGLYFGYTQRSLWNINASSSPFYDSSYMPELFYENLEPAVNKPDGWWHWLGYQAGVMHESNGRDELMSRSMNIAYVRPMLMVGRFDGWNLILAPRFFTYIGGLSDNPTLTDYRGFSEVSAIFGKNGKLAVAFTGRLGDGAHRGSVQFDVTYPLRAKLGDIASFFLLQYFDGYGEGLLNFDERSSTWRAGFSLVR